MAIQRVDRNRVSQLHRIHAALDALQRAQSLVEEAGQELCSVPGFDEQWTSVRNLYPLVKKRWHAINQRLETLLRGRGAN